MHAESLDSDTELSFDQTVIKEVAATRGNLVTKLHPKHFGPVGVVSIISDKCDSYIITFGKVRIHLSEDIDISPKPFFISRNQQMESLNQTEPFTSESISSLDLCIFESGQYLVLRFTNHSSWYRWQQAICIAIARIRLKYALSSVAFEELTFLRKYNPSYQERLQWAIGSQELLATRESCESMISQAKLSLRIISSLFQIVSQLICITKPHIHTSQNDTFMLSSLPINEFLELLGDNGLQSECEILSTLKSLRDRRIGTKEAALVCNNWLNGSSELDRTISTSYTKEENSGSLNSLVIRRLGKVSTKSTRCLVDSPNKPSSLANSRLDIRALVVQRRTHIRTSRSRSRSGSRGRSKVLSSRVHQTEAIVASSSENLSSTSFPPILKRSEFSLYEDMQLHESPISGRDINSENRDPNIISYNQRVICKEEFQSETQKTVECTTSKKPSPLKLPITRKDSIVITTGHIEQNVKSQPSSSPILSVTPVPLNDLKYYLKNILLVIICSMFMTSLIYLDIFQVRKSSILSSSFLSSSVKLDPEIASVEAILLIPSYRKTASSLDTSQNYHKDVCNQDIMQLTETENPSISLVSLTGETQPYLSLIALKTRSEDAILNWKKESILVSFFHILRKKIRVISKMIAEWIKSAKLLRSGKGI